MKGIRRIQHDIVMFVLSFINLIYFAMTKADIRWIIVFATLFLVASISLILSVLFADRNS